MVQAEHLEAQKESLVGLLDPVFSILIDDSGGGQLGYSGDPRSTASN